MRFAIATLAVALAACSPAEPSHNVATDTVRYLETGSTCEPGFTSPTYQTARCTLPDGSKIYCSVGPDVRDERGHPVGWSVAIMAQGKTQKSDQPSPQAPPPTQPPQQPPQDAAAHSAPAKP